MNLMITALTILVLGADPGTAVFPLLKIGQGCRASAMGESFTALSDDASAVYWNPAGLGLVTDHQFDLSHQEWFEGIRDEIGHAAVPLGPGALGLGMAYTGENDVRYWDPEQQKFAEFNAWGAMLTAGYGWRISDMFTVGATATGLYQDIAPDVGAVAGNVGYGGALDLGATGRITDNLGLGFAARHIGSMTYGQGFEKLPVEFALGGMYTISGDYMTDDPASTWTLNFTLDAVAPALDNSPNVRAGVEFKPIRQLAVRLGYRTGPVSLGDLGYVNGLTGGLGATLGNFGLDYAFAPYGELGMTHRIGLRLEVPPPQHGSEVITVLDAETRLSLDASIAVSGVFDTTALTSELVLTRLVPGAGIARVSLSEYSPAEVAFNVVAGKRGQDTVYLHQLLSNVVGGIYDAKTKLPIGGTLIHSGQAAGRITVPATPGTYAIERVKKGRYYLDASGPSDEYLAQVCTLDLAAGETQKRDFYLWKKGDLLYLMVNFETGKANILPEFDSDIDRAGAIIKQTPQIKKIELSGHTDPRIIRTKEFPSNWELSQARADAVKKYLVEKFGIDPNRLVTKGYADTKPIASNKTPEGMYKNRRTELRILE